MSTQAPEATGSPAGTDGAPQDGTASTTPEPQANGAGSPEPAATGSTDAPATSSQAEPDDKTARTIAAIRGEFKDERAKRQAAEKRLTDLQAALDTDKADRTKRDKALAVALGLAPEDEPPDPAKLAEELERTRQANESAAEALRSEIRQRDLRLAVLTQAPGLDANGLLLMDSLSFLRKLDGLDPAADDFTERVGEAIKAAAEANSQYRVTRTKPEPTIARSGGEHNGAPGGNRQWTLEEFQQATNAEIDKAQDDGLLTNLGLHPRRKRR